MFGVLKLPVVLILLSEHRLIFYQLPKIVDHCRVVFLVSMQVGEAFVIPETPFEFFSLVGSFLLVENANIFLLFDELYLF